VLIKLLVKFVVVKVVVVGSTVLQNQNTPAIGGAFGYCLVVSEVVVLSEKDDVAEGLVGR
jgi:hypothetical protein